MCKCKQVAMITLMWNANKVTWHLPNLTCKFISCTAILFYTYIVYKTGCPLCLLLLLVCIPPHNYNLTPWFPPLVRLRCQGSGSSWASNLPGAVWHQTEKRPFLTLSLPYYMILFSYAFILQSLLWEVNRRGRCEEDVSYAWAFCSVESWAAWDYQ